MFKSIYFIFLFLNLYDKLLQCHGNPLINIFAEDVEDFKSYIKDIKYNVNLDVNPCEDFQKYACKNVSSLSGKTLFKSSYFFVDGAVEKYLSKPETDLERKIINFYRKCSADFDKDDNEIVKDIFEKVDIFKEAGSLPSKKEYSAKEIIKLATKVYQFGDKSLINLEVKVTVDETDNMHVLKLRAANYIMRLNETYFQYLFKLTGSKEEDIDIAVKEILIFMDKLNKIYELRKTNESHEKIYIESFDEFNDVFPSKNWDWNEFYKSVRKLIKPNWKYKVLVEDVKLIKDVLELVDSTDTKVVANYLLLDHLRAMVHVKCGVAEKYFIFAIMSHFWNNFFTDKLQHHYLNFLDKFESQFNKTIKEEDDAGFYKNENTSDSTIYDVLKMYRNVIENHTNIYTAEVLENIYGDFNFDTSNIHQNVLNSVSNVLAIMWKLGAFDPAPSIYQKIINLAYDSEFDYDEGEHPLFYYDSVINFNFWTKYYEKNNYEYYKLKKIPCLENLVSLDKVDGEESNFLSLIRGFKNAFKNIEFDNYITEMKNIGEDAYWTNPKKLFFISIAQTTCHYENLFKALKYSDVFLDTFECSDKNINFDEFNKCYISG